MSDDRRRERENGAVLVHVAIMLLGLLAFSALAIDYGVLWASRRQAQNAADAAALSGATSLAFFDAADQDAARAAAAAAGQANLVWGQPPVIVPADDVTFPPCPPGAPPPPDTCVRADVFRNQDRQSALPTFFARLVGVTAQGVRATATAQVLTGNEVKCLKPFAIPDRWRDVYDVTPPTDVLNWTEEDRYERRYQTGPNKGDLRPEGERDIYVAPGDAPMDGWGQPTGFNPETNPDDIGTRVVLKWGSPNSAITPGWFFPIDLPREGPATGGDKYRENIASCTSLPVKIGDWVWSEPGDMIGPTKQGIGDLIALDEDAYWDVATKSIKGSCAEDDPPCANVSPRLVPIAVFSPEAYELLGETDKNQGRFQMQVTNILGFFVDDLQGNDVIGYMTLYPGMFSGTGGTSTSSFLRTVILVR